MRCRRVLDHLPLFVGGDLPPRVRESVARHLEGCPRCQTECAAYRRAREVLARYRKEAKPLVSFPDFWAALSGRIREEEGAALRPARILDPLPPPRGRSWQDFPLFAAAGFLVALLGFLPLRSWRTPEAPHRGGDPVVQAPPARIPLSSSTREPADEGRMPLARHVLVEEGLEEEGGPGATARDPRDPAASMHYHLPRLLLVSTSGSVE